MKETEYLSDEELFLLIDEIEDSGAEALPGDLKEMILDAVERPPKILELRRKYRRSCIQIGFAAAACALFFVMISGTCSPPEKNRKSILASVRETRNLSEIADSRVVMKGIGGSRVITGKIDEITKEPEKGD